MKHAFITILFCFIVGATNATMAEDITSPPEMPSVESAKASADQAPQVGTKVRVFDKNGKLVEDPTIKPKQPSLKDESKPSMPEQPSMEMMIKDFEKAIKEDNSFIVKTAIAPSFEGKFGEWNLLSMLDNSGNKSCYMVSYPFNKVQNHEKDRRPFIMVTIDKYKRPSFILAAGFYFYKNSNVSISIGSQHFNIDAKDYIAITRVILDDAKIVKAMLQGEKLMSYSRSNRGSYAVDVYSLNGFYQGYKRILEICV